MASIKVLASHPIQYQVPVWKELASRGCDIRVGYFHQGTAGKRARDVDFGVEMEWDVDLLSGYSHRFFHTGKPDYGWAVQFKTFPAMLAWFFQDIHTPILLVGWFVETIWLLWVLAILLRVPVFTLSDTTPQSFRRFPKPGWRVKLLGWLLRHSAGHLYVGELNRQFLLEMGVEERCLYHFPYSIDNPFFERETQRLSPDRHRLCETYGLDAHLPTFLFCGKLTPIKRPLELLKAYLEAGLKEQAQLIFVGEGVLRGELEKLIQESQAGHVHLLGFFNYSQLPLAYVLGQVLCLTSETDAWGLVVNEAMVCGRPVLVSDAVGCAPDLVDETNGWVAPADDLSALARVLRQAYEERHTWEEKGEQSLKKISCHTYSAMADGVQEALHSLNSALLQPPKV